MRSVAALTCLLVVATQLAHGRSLHAEAAGDKDEVVSWVERVKAAGGYKNPKPLIGACDVPSRLHARL